METTYLHRVVREHRYLHGLNLCIFLLFTEGASLLRFGIATYERIPHTTTASSAIHATCRFSVK